MNRRTFAGHLAKGSMGLALAGGATMTLGGCSALDDLETWVPVGLAAFDGVAAIVDGPFTLIASTVDAEWAAVTNAISLYTHTADPTTTTLDKVIAALDALDGGLTQAVNGLPIGIPAAILMAGREVLTLTIATLKAIQGKLEPAASSRVKTHNVQLAAGLSLPAPAKSKRDYVSKVNAIMAANGQTLRVR